VFTNPPDTVAYIGDTIRLLATSIGTSYQWSPATGLNDPAIANPMLTVSSDQIYTVEASTAAGCKGSTSFKVRAYQGPEIYVPNAFTPNGDAKNDYLRPIAVGIKSLHYFKVYNRWGQEVYSWTGNSRGNAVYDLRSRSDIGWNGKINGISQDTQTYVWVAEGVTSEGKVVQRKGTTTLIR
jgi:gliding motility-associated-like protein